MAAMILVSVTMTLQGSLSPVLDFTKRKTVSVMPAPALEVLPPGAYPFWLLRAFPLPCK